MEWFKKFRFSRKSYN